MKTIKHSLIFFILSTVLVCGVYPVLVTGVSNLLFSEKSNGGIITYKDQEIGAQLIAQEFTQDKYFWSRPSAAGFNASASSGSNYALTHQDLQKLILERKAKGLDYDLLTASASGLDPHISVKAAQYQIERVAHARSLDAMELNRIVQANIEKRQWGFLGEERVNVLELNLALEKLAHE
jgi:K+-transporting ATPase ATPase C chain